MLVASRYAHQCSARPADGDQARAGTEADQSKGTQEAMINKPTTRHQARTNAILCAEDDKPEMAAAWAAIAMTFPEDESVDLLADDQVIAQVPERVAEVLVAYPAAPGSIRVESAVWNVLRALAVRYLGLHRDRMALGSVDMEVTHGKILRCHWSADGENVVVVVEDNPVIR